MTTILGCPGLGVAQSLPELPRVFLDTTYVAPTGSVIPVPAGGDFQAALNAATPGTTLVLQAGATYTGNFTLPANPGPGWIYIQSSALASMPGGTRVTPAQAVLMPKIVTPNGSSAISSGGGSQKYRLAGLEITGTLTNTSSLQNNLVMLGGQSNHDFVLDRSFIHGQTFGNYKRGVEIEATRVAVVDSWIDDIHVDQDDTQGIIVWNGAGPLKIVNNTIRAGGENIILGPSNGTVVADVEIRGNLLEKPYSWRVGDPTFAGQHWTIKNLLELKNARRVLIDGNVLQNCWVDWNAAFGAQGASSLVLTTRNQWGTCNCPVEDVTITNNINRHLGRGIGIANLGGSAMQRILVRDNLWYDISAAVNDGIAFMVYSSSDIAVDHNTVFQDGIAIYDTPAPVNFSFTNNLTLLGGGIYGSPGPNPDTNNAVIGGPGNFPIVGNFFPATIAAVGFVNYAGGDYRLAPTSPYKNAGTDGKDIGADIVALNAATACAVSGACSGPPPPPITSISLSPASLDFGSATAGTTSVASIFWATNTGTTGVSVSGITVSGPFALSSTDCFSTPSWNGVMAPGTHCNVYMVFAPVTSGSATGTLTITAAGSSKTVALSGTGLSSSGAFSLSPTSVSFGSVNIGTTSAKSNVWVTSTGTTGLSVSSITVSGPFTLSTDCSPTSTWNGVMAPGTHCNVYVVFTPVTSGSVTGTLTVTAAGTSKTVALSGAGF